MNAFEEFLETIPSHIEVKREIVGDTQRIYIDGLGISIPVNITDSIAETLASEVYSSLVKHNVLKE